MNQGTESFVPYTLVEYDNYVEELFEYKLISGEKFTELKSGMKSLVNAEGKIYVHRTSIEQLKNAKKGWNLPKKHYIMIIIDK